MLYVLSHELTKFYSEFLFWYLYDSVVIYFILHLKYLGNVRKKTECEK